MTPTSSGNSRSVLWTGKPWVLPGVLVRSIIIIFVAIVVFWFEFLFGIADKTIASLLQNTVDLSGVPIISGWSIVVWTALVVTLAWILSTIHLLILRISHTYILHNDSLEVRIGIINTREYAISPSGFSDLEVFRSIVGRLMNSGDIIIRTQSETDSVKRLARVKNPLKVADQIRQVVARPIVRVEEPKR